MSIESLLLPITPHSPEALVLPGVSKGFLEGKTSPFSCWVALRCGSSRIAGKAVGGLKAKDNEGIIGSAFRLSVYPSSSFHTQPPDPTVLEPGGLACNTAITYVCRRSRRPSRRVLHSSTGTHGCGGQQDRRLAGLIGELGLPAQGLAS